MAGEKLAQLISDAKPSSDEFADLFFGKVTSTNPLKVNVTLSGTTLTLDSDMLILSEMVKEKKVEYDYPKITYRETKPALDLTSSASSQSSSSTTVQGFYIYTYNWSYEMAVTNVTDSAVYYDSFVSRLNSDSHLTNLNANTSTYTSTDVSVSGRVAEDVLVDFKVEDIKKEITLWEDLKVNESVIMIRGRSGQTWYIVGRL